MPFKGLRRNRSDKDIRRHSTFDLLRNPDTHLPPHAENPSPERAASPERSVIAYGPYTDGPPASPPIQHANPRIHKFSMTRFRHASESQLSVRAKGQTVERDVPTMPSVGSRTPEDTGSGLAAANDIENRTQAPAIVMTSPTMDITPRQLKHPRFAAFKRQLSKTRLSKESAPPRGSSDLQRSSGDGALSLGRTGSKDGGGKSRDLQRVSTASSSRLQVAPPAYGDESTSSLALPIMIPRTSESSRSDASSTDQVAYASTTTTVSTSTTTHFFRLSRRNHRKSLFPLPIKTAPPEVGQELAPATPRASTSGLSFRSQHSSPTAASPVTALKRRNTDFGLEGRQSSPLAFPSQNAFAKSSVSFAAAETTLLRNDSTTSAHSAKSSPGVLVPPMRFGPRNRSSTMGSVGSNSEEAASPTPPLLGSARNSTSTSGRTSLGGLLGLSRLRHGSEPYSPRHGSPGSYSKSRSFAMSREALVVPEREEGDTPGRYLERLEAAVSSSMIAGILSKSADQFAQSVLRSYARKFSFFGEPIDMSLRKFLMYAELPKETQQVDRVVQAFADRYHECNPGIFPSPDQAYIIAFSLMMLHTDAFNKNNKRKMQKADYIKNTSGQAVAEDILGCFYDNICYTPFIHLEDDIDFTGDKIPDYKPKKNKLKGVVPDSVKKPSTPLDPYQLIIESKLDLLRPSIKDSINTEDPYSYLGTASTIDISRLQKAFVDTGILQIMSARSRPSAFEPVGDQTSEAHVAQQERAGVVDLKVTKVGTLWRKNIKKKKTRSPWQEWGAILTGSQLYLFRNASWVKSLEHQYHQHRKQGKTEPVVFQPPVQEFKPDALIKIDDAVALLDSSYKKHKHAFTFVRHGGQEEVFLADNETEVDDWLAVINYAAAFRSAGVRIGGLLGVNYEGQRMRGMNRLDSTRSTRSMQTSAGQGTIQNRDIDLVLARQIMTARRQIIMAKIGEAEQAVAEANKQLDNMLRNARHLQVLAPIHQKTREAVVHAAARIDATLKWVRRSLWRIKCHRDILAMDVQEDARTVGESGGRSEAPADPVSPTKAGLGRLNSKAGTVASPPRSAISPDLSARPNTTSSAETFLANDVFKTPLEYKDRPSTANAWRLPPPDLNVPDGDQRGSVASTGRSISPMQYGMAPASSASSIRSPEIERLGSPTMSDSASRLGRVTPTPSVEDQDLLAKAGIIDPPSHRPDITPRPSYEIAPTITTPESSRGKSVRRSLHRTLRSSIDAHHHHPGSHLKHKRGKESASTITSDSGRTAADEDPDATPGLERAKGKFIIHGKQASVITFGGPDWDRLSTPSRRQHVSELSAAGPEKPRVHHRSSDAREMSEIGMAEHGRRRKSSAQTGESGSLRSGSTATAGSLRDDAEMAAAYTTTTMTTSTMTTTPTGRMVLYAGVAGRGAEAEEEEEVEGLMTVSPQSYFDPMVPFEDLEQNERRVRSRPFRGVSYELEASEPWRRDRGVEGEGAGAGLVSVRLGGDRWDGVGAEARAGRGRSAFSASGGRGVDGAVVDGDGDGDDDRREVEEAGGRENEEDEEEEVTRSSGIATARPMSGIPPPNPGARGGFSIVAADSPTVRITPATPDPSRRRQDKPEDEEDADARGSEDDEEEEEVTKAKVIAPPRPLSDTRVANANHSKDRRTIGAAAAAARVTPASPIPDPSHTREESELSSDEEQAHNDYANGRASSSDDDDDATACLSGDAEMLDRLSILAR
ncbi:hypothetical protein LTR66_011200 [Elasticomyces elasticus]|nr:hypothetical protein LTR66_011200 [Elasticomyces elasticus]